VVTAYPRPAIHGINFLFLLAQSLNDGWSFSSLHLDAQAKTYSQVLLEPETAVLEQDARDWGLILRQWKSVQLMRTP
tara:strand:+ start:666 stop:896 length:231 start_codon:yes stop_codon:yes gene_type:complete